MAAWEVVQRAQTLLLYLLLPILLNVHLVKPSAPQITFLHDGHYNATIYENSRARTYAKTAHLMGVPLTTLPSRAYIAFTVAEGDKDDFFAVEAEEIGGVTVMQIRTRTLLRDVLNRERRAWYNLTVQAIARGDGSSRLTVQPATANVNVRVIDKNDNIPLFFSNEYNATVDVGSQLHTEILILTAHDADDGVNGELYYYLEDHLDDNFAVDPTTGILRVTREPWITTLPLSVVVLAQDRGLRAPGIRSPTARTSVSITVKQVNLYDPKINVQLLPRVIQLSNYDVYAFITVTDNDVGIHGVIEELAIIAGDTSRLFSVIPSESDTSGKYKLVTSHLKDHKLFHWGYNLTLLASDKGTPPRHGHYNLHINSPEYEDIPIFSKELYALFLGEDSPPGTPTLKLSSSNNTLVSVAYHLISGNEKRMFHLDQDTGVLSTKDWLDADIIESYSFVIGAFHRTYQSNNIYRKKSTCKVSITVTDINDNSPQFMSSKYKVDLEENEPVGTIVTRVVATDLDAGDNGKISYSLVNSDNVPFEIDALDGIIRTTSLIDYESQQRVYTLSIRASDWGTPYKRESETTITIKVKNVVDSLPQYVVTECNGWVRRNAPLGSRIVKLVDLDLQSMGDITYRINGLTDNPCWTVNTTTIILTLTCDLRLYLVEEWNTAKTFILNVSATDGIITTNITKVVLKVLTDNRRTKGFAYVECKESNISYKNPDIHRIITKSNKEDNNILFPSRYIQNLHTPQISRDLSDSVEILEDVAVGTKVVFIKAADDDLSYNGQVVYALSGGLGYFKIGVHSGVIEVWSPLDRETLDKYHLNITVYDLGLPHRSSSKEISIHILDVNDNAPKFSQDNYSLHLPENTLEGTSVAQILATDDDEDELNAKVTYELLTDIEEFKINADSGVIYVSGPLDREKQPSYDLRLLARDNAPDGSLSTITNVHITILDVNDCAPDFGASKMLTIGIPEDMPLGVVVATMTATDRDLGPGGRVSYSIENSIGKAPFRIDPKTGIVRVSGSLDYEMRTSYNITVRAQDSGRPSMYSYGTLLVKIQDVDENLGGPTFSEHIVKASVKENQPARSLVTKLKAEDPDGDDLSYTITAGTGLGLFTVDDYGNIHTLRVLDREVSRGYWLTVVVSDVAKNPRTDTTQVWVEVEDLNDHVPQTPKPAYLVQLAEDEPVGTLVTTLQAQDGDIAPSTPSFFISSGNSNQHFSIDTRSGDIRTLASLDRETVAEYELQITVSDGQLSSVTSVTITLTDVNDNIPQFLQSLYRVNIPTRSKTKLKQQIFSVVAVDKDSGVNSALEYRIKTGRGKRFNIHPTTGQVFSNRAFKAGQTFKIVVEVSDKGIPSMSSTMRVLLRVSDVPSNSTAPPMISPTPPVNVMETDSPGQTLALIHAYDLDNGTLWYYITGGDVEGQFSIDVNSGILSLARPIDYEQQNRYIIQIAVTDGLHFTETEVVIELLDANDQWPKLSQVVYNVNISESAMVMTSLLTLSCQDNDESSKQAPVYFSLHHSEAVHSVGFFVLDSTSGELILAKPLDREVSENHQITVSCRDRGRTEHADFARVYIRVTDDNDHKPFFIEEIIYAKISSGASPGSMVTQAQAFDGDTGDNGRLSYSIIKGNVGGFFYIDESLGTVHISRTLAISMPSEYQIMIRAQDHGSQMYDTSVTVNIEITSDINEPPNWNGIDIPNIVEVSEWTTMGSSIANVGARPSNSLTYRITSGNTPYTFMVSPSSGIVSVVGDLDREFCTWYNLTITVFNAVGSFSSRWLGVRVLDENDWWPQWKKTEHFGIVMDTYDIGSPVLDALMFDIEMVPLAIKATDQDEGENGKISYSIIEETAAKYFSINVHTGSLYVSGSLAEVSNRTVTLSIWASDSGSPKRHCSTPAVVSIKVEKLKKEEPFFSQKEYNSTLYIPTVKGVKVLCIDGLKIENGKYDTENTNTEYTISDGNELNKFDFDSSSLCLFVKNQNNLKNKYNLTLQATSGVYNASTILIIQVKAVPKSDITFREQSYYINVMENSTKEMNMISVGVNFLPLNQNIHYEIVNPTEYFEIHITSGIIKTTGKLVDYEAGNHHVLMVKAFDVDDPQNFSFVMVNIAVIDVNDNTPTFVNQPFHALVTTSAQIEDIIIQVHAIDSDSGIFGIVRYELASMNTGIFVVDEMTGDVMVNETVGAAGETYIITITAYDGGKPSLSSQAQVHVRVVSAASPIFSSSTYRLSIPEDVPTGSVITMVDAQAATKNDLVFTIIQGNINDNFYLDYNPGLRTSGDRCMLRLLNQLDYETVSHYNLTVRARDPVTGLYANARVEIILKDVNDNKPQFEEDLYRVQVSEAAHIGYSVLKVVASDVDTGLGGRVHYICVSNCNAFHIGMEDGQITLKQELDAETLREHKMQILVKDQGLPSLSATTTVTIDVVDINDNPPVWQQSTYSCHVSAEAQPSDIIMSVKANDADISQLDPLIYQIHSGDSYNMFRLGETSGILSIVAPHRLNNSSILNISVSDGIHIAFTELQVHLLSFITDAPMFTMPLYNTNVKENSEKDQLLLKLPIKNYLQHKFRDINYLILHQTHPGAFYLDRRGYLYNAEVLDREKESLHIIHISVTNERGQNDFTIVEISVKDENDNSPRFLVDEYQGNIIQDAQKGTSILKVEAIDEDEGLNGKIIYSINYYNNKEASKLFNVNPLTGHLTLSRNTVLIANEMYQFFIRAEDRGIPSRNRDIPVTVLILPSNKYPPKCPRQYAQFFMREDSPLGAIITTLWTSGPTKVKYSVLSDENYSNSVDEKSFGNNKKGMFAINSEGLIVLQKPLDREILETHHIVIANETTGILPLIDYMTISIVVMDVNDCSPYFSEANFDGSVSENSQIGTTITVVTASDDDEGTNGEIFYSIQDSHDPDVMSTFHIDPHSGAIILASYLDWESKKRYSFSVVATDAGTPPLTASCHVEIHVKDFNDNPPSFIQGLYEVSIPEDSDIGTLITTFNVSDADETVEYLNYFITDGDPKGDFLVNASGSLYVMQALDRESQDSYLLSIFASDGKFYANTTISIAISDVNDNGPQCINTQYSKTVSENATVGTHVTSIVVWDADIGAGARNHYKLRGDGANDFVIDKLTGQVFTASQLDRETQAAYDLIVLVVDWEIPELQCQTKLQINVNDINDNAATFTHDQYNVTVPEDAPVNSVVIKIKATDMDFDLNRQVRYSLIDSYYNHFNIDQVNGIISLAKSLDREAKDFYHIIVEARDLGTPSLSSTVVVAVFISDVNDNAPEFSLTTFSATLKENIDLGTEILTVMATSRDIGKNAEMSYTLEQNTINSFLKINPKSGVISTGHEFDFEKMSQLLASVIATDGGTPPLSSSALINITITDINDNPPEFSELLYASEVKEDLKIGSSVLHVIANDLDSGKNGEVRYNIGLEESIIPFVIDPKTGLITLIQTLDREQVEEYQFEVKAHDLGSPVKTQNTRVMISVIDVNDNTPNFSKTNYTAIVKENERVGYFVLKMSATDADADPNGSFFTWELLEDKKYNTSFMVEQDGSIILSKSTLNHKVQSLHILKVRVWDSGSPPLYSDTKVIITVVEKSKYPPTVYPFSAVLVNYRNPYPSGSIAKITAFDKDPYDDIVYSIKDSSRGKIISNYFVIDRQNGTLVSLVPLDTGFYWINVSVSDGQFETIKRVSIQVSIISEDILDCSVILTIGSLSMIEFLSRYQKTFLKVLTSELALNMYSPSILSVRPVYLDSRTLNKEENKVFKSKREVKSALNILIAVQISEDSFLQRQNLIRQLKSKQKTIKQRMSLEVFRVMDTQCNEDDICSGFGRCVDIVTMSQESSKPIITQRMNMITPDFIQTTSCQCFEGRDGVQCEDIINACGLRPCAEYQECTPTDLNTVGYTCQCPLGFAGPSCKINLSKCREPKCHYAVQPLSFNGNSFAQYSIPHLSQSSSFSLTLYIRTKYPTGTIMYLSGIVEYSILEISNSHIQFRWNCGGGEGLVKVSSVNVDNGKWHFINVTREGIKSSLQVDDEQSLGSAPGFHDQLNIDTNFIIFGAKSVKKLNFDGSFDITNIMGFVGCLDTIQIYGTGVPISIDSSSISKVNLKKLQEVEHQCPLELEKPGVCGSYPCLNGGTCIEKKRKKFRCRCQSKFIGEQCQIDTEPCSSIPCLNGGTCTVEMESFQCQCPSKLSGKQCEYGIYCNPNPCHNGGSCEEGRYGPICKCTNFSGVTCKEDINECAQSNLCQNGGTCINTYGGFRCLCHLNTTGDYCSNSLKNSKHPSFIRITLEGLIIILSVFLSCLTTILIVAACQRRRWKQTQQRQNNAIPLTEMHVRNDLRAGGCQKRNSKMCNIEADQASPPPLPPRPLSYSPSSNDSLFHTLKHLAELTTHVQDNSDVSTINRHILKKKKTEEANKPWKYHNNLNDAYFVPIKDLSYDLPSKLEGAKRISPGTTSETFSEQSVGFEWDDYDVRESRILTDGLGARPAFAINDGLTTSDEAIFEGLPSMNRLSGEDEQSSEEEGAKALPLFTSGIQFSSVHSGKSKKINREVQDSPFSVDSNQEDDEDYTFEEILHANNISMRTNMNSKSQYNIVSDFVDESLNHTSKLNDNLSSSYENVDVFTPKFGNPRSRRPFNRSDYGRISDVSFLSSLDGDGMNDNLLEAEESLENNLNYTKNMHKSFSDLYSQNIEKD